MGCDIHLILERRRREPKKFSEYYTEGTEWQKCYITGYDSTWSDRIYGMFARLANVRNYDNEPHIELRGFPEDATEDTRGKYLLWVVSDEKYKEYEDKDWDIRCCSESDANKWVRQGCSDEAKMIGDRRYITHPDYHSPNWCTTQEMEDCINAIFHKDGEWNGDYEEWVALLGAMKGYESTGEYECRAVFWFDN